METLELIIPTPKQIQLLYTLLLKRTHCISHKKKPTYSEHQQFVEKHPYRYWFLARFHSEYIGTIYVKDDNSIGVNLENNPPSEQVNNFINLILQDIQPLPPITSIRGSGFYINVAPDNQALSQALTKRGCSIVQITYKVPI